MTTASNLLEETLKPFGFYEFFSGGGMARLGLGAAWKCLFSNDIDAKKIASYQRNFSPAFELLCRDVAEVKSYELPDTNLLAWASFPCQDLSLAGNGKGLSGDRSGVFWSFWELMQKLKVEGRHPPIIAIENVPGLITSHSGEDLRKIIIALTSEGYRIGGLVIDAALFVAQSRPRLFLVAVAKGVVIPKGLIGRVPNPNWHPSALQDVVDTLKPEMRKNWIWWKLPAPKEEASHLVDILERKPKDVTWHTAEQTKQLLQMMSPGNLAKVSDAKRTGELKVGTVYRRTRKGVQRAEVRFDGVSGCLRTPSGGSSRQIVMIVEDGQVRTRLISARETARLMGLPEWYVLPQRYNDAYYLTGDGVVVPVVSWIEQHILRPIALSARRSPIGETQTSLELISA